MPAPDAIAAEKLAKLIGTARCRLSGESSSLTLEPATVVVPSTNPRSIGSEGHRFGDAFKSGEFLARQSIQPFGIDNGASGEDRAGCRSLRCDPCE